MTKYYLNQKNRMAVCYKQTRLNTWHYWSWVDSNWEKTSGSDKSNLKQVSKSIFYKRLKQGIIL